MNPARRALPALLAAVAALAALGTPSAHAADDRAVLDGQGVTVTRHGSRVVFHFAGTAQGRAAHRRFAGRRAKVECEALPPEREVVYTTSEVTADVRVSRRRGPVSVELRTRDPLDWCSLEIDRPSGNDTTAILGLNGEGRTYIDRVFAASLLIAVDLLLERQQDTSAAAVAKASKGFVVALDTPEGTPPYGRVGYWTDGTRQVRVVVGKDGYRLFLETEGETVRSNALRYITGLD